MRDTIQSLLDGADLGATSIGKLRGELESAMKLAVGALDSKKDQVNKVLQEEIMKKLAVAEEEDAKKAEKHEEKKRKSEGTPTSRSPAPQTAVSMPGTARPAGRTPGQTPGAIPAASTPAPESFVKKPEPPAPKKARVEKVEKAFVPSKTWAVSGSEDCTLRLWNLESHSCAKIMEGHAKPVSCLAVDWESMQAVSGAEDGIRCWDLKLGSCNSTSSDFPDGCTSLCADWKARRAVAGCGNGHLKVTDIDSGEQQKIVVAGHPGGVWALSANFAKDRLLSGGDDSMKLWDTKEWKMLHKISGHPGGIISMCTDWHDWRAFVGAGESLRRWDLEKDHSANLLGHRDAVSSVRADWSEDVGVSGSWDATLRVWNLEKGSPKESWECSFGRVRSLAVDFSKMEAICGSSAGALHFVDLKNGKAVRVLDGHIGGVTALEAVF